MKFVREILRTSLAVKLVVTSKSQFAVCQSEMTLSKRDTSIDEQVLWLRLRRWIVKAEFKLRTYYLK
jgi:hypothetical protein